MNEIGEKWPTKELYEVCPVCDGIGAIDRPGGEAECPGCEGVGFMKTGWTVGEIERLLAERDRLGRQVVEGRSG